MGAFRMEPVRVRAVTGLCAAFAVVSAGCTGPAPATDAGLVAYAEIVAEEDARGLAGLERVHAHLENGDGTARAYAARALGRLEDPGQLPLLETMLYDPDPAVRAVAAMAMAQAVFRVDPGAEANLAGADEIDRVRRAFASRVGVEDDPIALGSLAANLGRLAQPGAGDGAVAEPDRAAVEAGLAAIAQRLEGPAGDAPATTGAWACPTASCEPMAGLARGIEAFARRRPGTPLSPDLLAAAVRLSSVSAAVDGDAPADAAEVADASLGAARVRRLAAAAMVHADQLTPLDAARLLQDEDWGVRRQVVISALRNGADADTDTGAGTGTVIRTGLQDPDPRVRVEAVRSYDRWMRPGGGCEAILRAMDDDDPHVSNVAIGLLARPCPDPEAQRQALANRAAVLADGDSDWRGPARALHALAGIAPGEVGDGVAGAARHTSPFVRAWAARAAAVAGDVAALEGLSGDSDANVREAALRGLGAVAAAAGREAYLAALASDDPQLVMTATRLLVEHAPAETPISALLAPLARFTAAERETERDVRVALLDGIGAVGGVSRDDLAPYLTDFDPVVADLAAALLSEASGAPEEAAPRPLPRAPTPDATRLAELARSVVRLRMAGLGDIVIALRPDLAATNADRFARLASEGYFDGLTFHRVEPNFVIQGGSPHANEYAGDGPFSRDEISAQPHWRGTVGLSTRGRDTGDAQIFINLADNVRLDFNYTIYGVVVEGMEVVDAIQEGAVIESAEVLAR